MGCVFRVSTYSQRGGDMWAPVYSRSTYSATGWRTAHHPRYESRVQNQSVIETLASLEMVHQKKQVVYSGDEGGCDNCVLLGLNEKIQLKSNLLLQSRFFFVCLSYTTLKHKL